jgi:FkbM family methyltransferase
MFWLLRFRGETIGDTLALWINAIVWQIQKLFYKITHPNSTKQEFAMYIHLKKPHRHWTKFPIDISENHYYDNTLRVWMDAVGIHWFYFLSDYPSEWLNSLCAGQIGFDIGAHRGYWSIFYHKRVLPEGIIIAWEPYSRNYQKMLQNIAKNNISNVIPLRLAAWRESALLDFEEVSDLDIKSFIVKTKEDKKGRILATSVDKLVDSLGLPRLDWIKIDIEGAEVEALKGAMKTLLTYRPTLWLEFHGTLQEVKALLAEANYEIKGEIHLSPGQYREYGHLWAVPQAPVS